MPAEVIVFPEQQELKNEAEKLRTELSMLVLEYDELRLEPHLIVGDKLYFFREADNHFDSRAIAVRNKDGVKIGYVPKKDNVVFSRLMDAGKLLFGKITSKQMQGAWLKTWMDIYLHE